MESKSEGCSAALIFPRKEQPFPPAEAPALLPGVLLLERAEEKTPINYMET